MLPNAIAFTHLESLSDPASWDDGVLDREHISGFDSETEQKQLPNKKSSA